MKKILVTAFFASIIACYFWSCEKDDICAEGTATTPNMIVTFYNKENPELPKPGSFKFSIEGSDKEISKTSIDSVALPLPTNAEMAKWKFTLVTSGVGGTTNENVDYIEFKYTHNEIYVSRACGYKSLFYLNDEEPENPNPILTDDASENNIWIDEVIVLQKNIENENAAHIKILY
ncbi:hypothetical protein GCM10007424_01000 [Flavobacterium suaedae]|uniref:Lipoprotein n=1 Tax=Flavobacterium suaedae TaxID=1767027 RepID=A0ABQ1JE48_9FLAO|nr:DUF6452 family protein [Flavobacterium suaedae]GGB64888.1 hypothetical protein GCM10007424_01000 [Flavobacterium suaedae]